MWKPRTLGLQALLLLFLVLNTFIFSGLCDNLFGEKEEKETQSEAGISLDQWFLERDYPGGLFSNHSWVEAASRLISPELRGTPPANWQNIGPNNVGGRTLCLAFDPQDSLTIYAGTAGGGLWKTTTAGKGANAWQRIDLGFPVCAVSSILVHPTNSHIIYVGTGEVYNPGAAWPGTVNRFTRGIYGQGIFKSDNGGLTWSQVLDWNTDPLKGTQALCFNPLNPKTVYAATSTGLYRTLNSGISWSLIHPVKMAVDVIIPPQDTNIILVTHGSYFGVQSGIYRSENNGLSFTMLNESANGIPSGWTGKSLLSLDDGINGRIFASVADAELGLGIYCSEDYGLNWFVKTKMDIPQYQGWYSHDVCVAPDDAFMVMMGGIDLNRSITQGSFPVQISYWQEYYQGCINAGQPEGSSFYIHSDIHAVYFDPSNSNRIYCATDGGVFCSEDKGNSWEGRNGGLVSSQFYANISAGQITSDFVVGGLQDNASVIYKGNHSWCKVCQGDGMNTAIKAGDDKTIICSSQFLNLYKSIDGGENFSALNIPENQGANTAFNSPFLFAPNASTTLYAGSEKLLISLNSGVSWDTVKSGVIKAGNVINKIAISPINPFHILISSVPVNASFVANKANLYRSTGGGIAFNLVTGLPDRYCTDIKYDPANPNIVYATFSGFNTAHIYKSKDGGVTWKALMSGLPDVPFNCVFIDPKRTSDIYVGTDIGVFISVDSGEQWAPFSSGIPAGTLVTSMAISGTDNPRWLYAATHGLGVFRSKPMYDPTSIVDVGGGNLEILNFHQQGRMLEWLLSSHYDFEKLQLNKLRIELTDLLGRKFQIPIQIQGNKIHAMIPQHISRNLYVVSLMHHQHVIELQKIYVL